MIARLKGKLESKTVGRIIVDVGGVGYLVHVTLSTYSKLPEEGEPVSLNIYTHVREDALTLFGFHSEEEKRIFLLLLDVPDIGPKMASDILSGISVHDLVRAINARDIARMTSIPKVGKKRAEKIIIELSDKLAGFISAEGEGAAPVPGKTAVEKEALSALLNLGFSRAQAEQALERLSGGLDLETLIRDALKLMGK